MFSPDFFTSLIDSYFHEPHASLLNGILFGKKLEVTRTFYEQLKEVGLIHIVVLSGMNITLLTAIVMSTIVPFVGRKVATIVTIMTIILFILFVGAEPPIVRAGIMGGLSLIAILYGRKTLALYSLFLSAIIMLIINRDWVTSISFQLSFAATLGIILFGNMPKDTNDEIKSNTNIHEKEKLNSRDKGISISVINWIPNRVRNDMRVYIYQELRISLAAQVFTVPLIFWYFRQISFISPLANILISWMIAPIMVLGLIVVMIGTISPQAGFILSWILYPMLNFLVWVVRTLSEIPFASVKM